MKENKYINWIILTSGISFLLFYILLCYGSRPVADDFQLICDYQTYGVWESLNMYFHNWSFRWAALGLMGLVSVSGNFFPVFPWHFFIYLLLTQFMFIHAVSLWLRFLLNKFFQITVSNILILGMSLHIVAGFFLFSFYASEIYFWYCANFEYLMSLILMLYGLYAVLKNNRFFPEILMIVPCFLYIGGCIETFALFPISLLLLIGINQIRNFKKEKKKHQLSKTAIAAALCISSLLFNVSGEGNIKRYFAENKSEESFTVSKTQAPSCRIDSLERLSERMFSKKYIVYFFSLIPWLWFGLFLKKNAKTPSHSHKQKMRRWSIIILLLLIFTTLIPFLFIYGNLGPERAWALFLFYINVLFFAGIFYLGYKIKMPKNKIMLFSKITLVILTLIYVIYFIRQYPMVTAYAKAFDTRKEMLLKLNLNPPKDTVFLEPLPNAGMLINADDNFYLQRCAYNFPIELKQKK